MNIGYSAWGFVSDYKLDRNYNELSTPDGNSTYTWSILYEAQRRGYKTFWMQEDRDIYSIMKHKGNAFNAFSRDKRIQTYFNTVQTAGKDLPELDLLLVEWRFPIQGRNVGISYEQGRTPDLDRQTELLLHYSNCPRTKIVLWDLDHKLTKAEYEKLCEPKAIIETSVKPLTDDRISVEVPFIIDDLLQFKSELSQPENMIAYVGSRYERDDVIEEWIKPISDQYKDCVHFWGNWTRKDVYDEVIKMWPNIHYHDRIQTRSFLKAYSSAGCCPLLAKKSYFETGFITARVWESILFGTLPVGLKPHLQIEKYCNHVVSTVEELKDFALYSSSMMTLSEKKRKREEAANKLEFMDAKYFINQIEDITWNE